EIQRSKAALLERLEALNQAVTDRLSVSGQRRSIASSIRKTHADFLEGITPAIDDANFELMTGGRGPADNAGLNGSLEALRRLLEVQAEANLLAGLLTESSQVTESARLQPLRDLVAAARRKIEANLV